MQTNLGTRRPAIANVSTGTEGFRRRGSDAFAVQMPWKILIPHSTTTMADTSVAAVNTLSKEATLMLLSASQPANGLVDSLIPLQLRDCVVLNVVGGCGLQATYLRRFPQGMCTD